MWDTITAPAPTHLKIVHHPEIDTEERGGQWHKKLMSIYNSGSVSIPGFSRYRECGALCFSVCGIKATQLFKEREVPVLSSKFLLEGSLLRWGHVPGDMNV